MVSVFQIYYNSKTEKYLDKAFIPHSNEYNTPYFENMVIKTVNEINPLFKDDYIGVSSWKMNQKTNLTGTEIIDYIKKDSEQGKLKDVYIYSPIQGFVLKSYNQEGIRGIIQQHTIWDGHRNRKQVARVDNILNVARILPFDLYDGKWQYCYCNFWIAKKEIFNEYCKTVLSPAINFFERADIKAQMPDWFIHSSGKKYNSACFTLEGLFGSFLAHTNYTFDYICKPKIGRLRKMVTIDGYEIK